MSRLSNRGSGDMDVRRRGFLRCMLGASGAMLAAPLFLVLERVTPVRYVEAMRAKFYPGLVTRLDEKAIGRRGKWAG